jgi:hypothetical protein
MIVFLSILSCREFRVRQEFGTLPFDLVVLQVLVGMSSTRGI